MSDIRATIYETVRPVTQSDTVSDVNGPFVAIEATTGAGLCKITTPRGDTTTVYLVLGVPKNIATSQVWSSVTAATGIVGYCAMPWKAAGKASVGT
jgi:hypothetical protein